MYLTRKMRVRRAIALSMPDVLSSNSPRGDVTLHEIVCGHTSAHNKIDLSPKITSQTQKVIDRTLSQENSGYCRGSPLPPPTPNSYKC